MYRPIVSFLSVVVLLALAADIASAQGLGVVGDLVTEIDGSRTLHVRSVALNGLAQRLGIRPGDRIINVNGYAPGDALINQRAIASGGGLLSVVVSRRGAMLRLGDRSPPTTPDVIIGHGYDSNRFPIGWPGMVRPSQRPGPDLLVDLDEINDLSGRRVHVHSINPGGRGYREGLRTGDTIESVNGLIVRTLRDVRESYYYRGGQITITYIRGTIKNRITLVDKTTARKSLGLTTVMTAKREVKVTGADPKGLGNDLGIAQRGTVITRVNGKPIKTPADMKRLDQSIMEGKVTFLEIEFIPPGGRAQVIRRRL